MATTPPDGRLLNNGSTIQCVAQRSERGASTNVPHLLCERCAVNVVPRVYQRGPHLRADCPKCGRYLRFVPRTPLWLAVLAPEPTLDDNPNLSLFGDGA